MISDFYAVAISHILFVVVFIKFLTIRLTFTRSVRPVCRMSKQYVAYLHLHLISAKYIVVLLVDLGTG